MRYFLIGILLLSLGCKFGKQNWAPNTSPNSVMAYFNWIQYDLESTHPNDSFMSSFFGMAFVAKNINPTFEKWSTPPIPSCLFTAQDQPDIVQERIVDIGNLKIKGSNRELELPKGKSNPIFSARGF